MLSEAKDEDAKKKEVLLNFYSHAEICFDKLDDKILALLQTNRGNVKEKMKNHQIQLKMNEYFLLVAGNLKETEVIFMKLGSKQTKFMNSED